MPLRSTQPLTEMSTRNLPGGKVRPVRKADKLTAICELTVYKIWVPRRLTTLWASTACYRDSFTFLHFFIFLLRSRIGFSGLLPFGTNLELRILQTVGRTPCAGDQPCHKAVTYTGQHKHRRNMYENLCHEWDSNPRATVICYYNAFILK
jgi:hypothetical protein